MLVDEIYQIRRSYAQISSNQSLFTLVKIKNLDVNFVVGYDAVEALSVISLRCSVCCEPCRPRICFCFCAVILVYARVYFMRVVVVYLT